MPIASISLFLVCSLQFWKIVQGYNCRQRITNDTGDQLSIIGAQDALPGIEENLNHIYPDGRITDTDSFSPLYLKLKRGIWFLPAMRQLAGHTMLHLGCGSHILVGWAKINHRITTAFLYPLISRLCYSAYISNIALWTIL